MLKVLVSSPLILRSALSMGTLLLLGCSARRHEYAEVTVPAVAAETYCAYHKSGDTVHVTRVLTAATGASRVLRYALWPTEAGNIRQQLQSEQALAGDTRSRMLAALRQRRGIWQPPTGEQELFVQIRPARGEGGVSLLDLRQEVEGEIDDALAAAGIGQWTAGDLGMGGGNMLFAVTDVPRAQRAIRTVLRAYELESRTIIARRVTTAADDWTYEVIYPENYSGVFCEV